MNALLAVSLAGRRAALPAERIHSVIEPAAVALVPGAPPHVAGLAMLRSRPLTLIDCSEALGLPVGPAAGRRAVVIEHSGHLYGLLFDDADALVEARGEPVPLAADPGPGWREAAAAMVETAEGPLPLLDIMALIDGPEGAHEG